MEVHEDFFYSFGSENSDSSFIAEVKCVGNVEIFWTYLFVYFMHPAGTTESSDICVAQNSD